MSETKSVPKVRFDGFSGAWEEREIDNYIEEYIERTTVENQYPVLTSSQQKGIVLQEDYFANRQVTTDENIGYYVLPKGYFTYRSRSDNDYFVFNRNDIIEKGIISYYYPVFRANNADSDFLLRRINYGIERDIAVACEGTGQRVLSFKKFKKIVAMFPSQTEQAAIGNFFRNLDNTIALKKQHHEKTVNIKKAMLEKMFPKKGATEPEIRFAGFTGAWEEKSFDEVLVVNSGKDYKHLNAGTIPVYGTGGYMLSVSDSLSNVDGVGIGRKGTIDKPQYLKAPYWTVDTLFFLTANEGYDLRFIYTTTQIINWKSYNAATGVPSLSKTVIEEITQKYPTYKEQIAISNFFRNLDEIIETERQEIEKLQNIKNACLNRMFI